jgi:hypothetical protein
MEFEQEYENFINSKSPIKLDNLTDVEKHYYKLSCEYFFKAGAKTHKTVDYLSPTYSKEQYSKRTFHGNNT